MSVEEKPPPPLPKLVKLSNAFKLAEQWVNNMSGEVDEETGETEMESRPSRLGLGARFVRKSQVGPLNDPVARMLHKKLDVRRKRPAGEKESMPSGNNHLNDDSGDDENEDSRTNAFANKRPAPLSMSPRLGSALDFPPFMTSN